MKHSIEFDLNDKLDAAKFGLQMNQMFIMDTVSKHLFELHNIVDSKKPDIKEIKRLLEETQTELLESLSAFHYLDSDGICEDCQAKNDMPDTKELN